MIEYVDDNLDIWFYFNNSDFGSLKFNLLKAIIRDEPYINVKCTVPSCTFHEHILTVNGDTYTPVYPPFEKSLAVYIDSYF